MMFDKNLLEQFKTNRHERIGALYLIIFMTIAFFTFNHLTRKKTKKEKTNPELAQVLKYYYANLPEETKRPTTNYNQNPEKKWPKKKSETNKPIEYSVFNFDPNKIAYDDLIKLSFTSKQANTLLKFRASGYKFKKVEDLRKVHGLDQTLLEKIEPYVDIPKDSTKSFVDKDILKDTIYAITKKVEKLTEKIELNKATHEDLVKIYGIGDIYAGIIIKYRDKLGGYVNLSQIQEAFNFPDSTLLILKNSLTLDTTHLNKLNLNEVTFKELLAHPYLSYEQNQILYPFIETRRPIQDLSVLNKIMILDTAVVTKLIPYLTVE